MNPIKLPGQHHTSTVPFLPESIPLLEARNAPQRLARRTADVLVDVLLDHDVEVVFGLPGGTISPIFDALLDRPEIRVVTAKQESGAMFAAAGYAQTSGKIAVVMVTSGPGAINSMTGLASAFCDGLPVLLLAGEVPRKVYGKGALQEGSSYHLDIVGMSRRITKFAAEIHEPNTAPSMLRRAIATALSGRRGPVMMTVPIDVSSAPIVESSIVTGATTSFTLSPAAVARVARALETAGKPLLFAGSGCRQGRAAQALRELAEKLQVPVMTTPKGKGVFPENHRLSLGVFGFGGHPSAMRYLEGGVDVLVAVGTSLGDLSTNGWSNLLAAKQEFVHVDIDAGQLGRAYSSTLSIAAPADMFLRATCDASIASGDRAWHGVKHHMKASESTVGATNLITPPRALWELQEILPADTIFTCDAGEHFLFATHYLRVTEPDGFLVMTGLGSMGTSIGGAMGAKLAKPSRPVAAIIGDGCFAMSCTEISTAVAERLPIAIVVMNDQRLGMVELGHSALYGRTPAYPLSMDVGGMARALGAQTIRVEKPGQLLDSKLPELLRGGPVVVDVHIDPSIAMPKNARFEALGSAQAPKAPGSARRHP